MPHKRNPVNSEQVCGLARVVRSNSIAALEDVALWHERDISHSSVERVILPDSTILVDYMLAKMTGIVENMRVFPERMLANLESTGGLIFSGQLLLDLVEAGAPRDEAYKWVQENAMSAWEATTSAASTATAPGGSSTSSNAPATFHQRVSADSRITKYLNAAAIARAFDITRQLHAVDSIFSRVFTE